MADKNYYKLINGKLEEVPINKDGILNYYLSDKDTLEADGYKKLIKADKPLYPYTITYKETKKQIKEIVVADEEAITKNEENKPTLIQSLRVPKTLLINTLINDYNLSGENLENYIIEHDNEQIKRNSESLTNIINEFDLDETEIDNMYLRLNHLL